MKKNATEIIGSCSKSCTTILFRNMHNFLWAQCNGGGSNSVDTNRELG